MAALNPADFKTWQPKTSPPNDLHVWIQRRKDDAGFVASAEAVKAFLKTMHFEPREIVKRIAAEMHRCHYETGAKIRDDHEKMYGATRDRILTHASAAIITTQPQASSLSAVAAPAVTTQPQLQPISLSDAAALSTEATSATAPIEVMSVESGAPITVALPAAPTTAVKLQVILSGLFRGSRGSGLAAEDSPYGAQVFAYAFISTLHEWMDDREHPYNKDIHKLFATELSGLPSMNLPRLSKLVAKACLRYFYDSIVKNNPAIAPYYNGIADPYLDTYVFTSAGVVIPASFLLIPGFANWLADGYDLLHIPHAKILVPAMLCVLGLLFKEIVSGCGFSKECCQRTCRCRCNYFQSCGCCAGQNRNQQRTPPYEVPTREQQRIVKQKWALACATCFTLPASTALPLAQQYCPFPFISASGMAAAIPHGILIGINLSIVALAYAIISQLQARGYCYTPPMRAVLKPLWRCMKFMGRYVGSCFSSDQLEPADRSQASLRRAADAAVTTFGAGAAPATAATPLLQQQQQHSLHPSAQPGEVQRNEDWTVENAAAEEDRSGFTSDEDSEFDDDDYNDYWSNDEEQPLVAGQTPRTSQRRSRRRRTLKPSRDVPARPLSIRQPQPSVPGRFPTETVVPNPGQSYA